MRSYSGEGLLAPPFKPPPPSDLLFFPSSLHPASASRSASSSTSSSSLQSSRSPASSSSSFYASPTTSPPDHFSASLFPYSHHDTHHSPFKMMTQEQAVAHANKNFYDFYDFSDTFAADNGLQGPPAGGNPFEQFHAQDFAPTNNYGNQSVAHQMPLLAQQAMNYAPTTAQQPSAQGLNIDGLDMVSYPAFDAPSQAPYFTRPNQQFHPQLQNSVPMVPAVASNARITEIDQVHELESDSQSEPKDKEITQSEGALTGAGNPGFVIPASIPMTPANIKTSVNDIPDHLFPAFMDAMEERARSNPISSNTSQPAAIAMVPAQAMEIDSEVDGIPDVDQSAVRPTLTADQAKRLKLHEQARVLGLPEPTIDRVPVPGVNGMTKDRYLTFCRSLGVSYKDIKERGGFTEAESTLRGRYRTLTKRAETRLRKPTWSEKDVRILCQAVAVAPLSKENKTSWKNVAAVMKNMGADYAFGFGALAKKWNELQANNSTVSSN